MYRLNTKITTISKLTLRIETELYKLNPSVLELPIPAQPYYKRNVSTGKPKSIDQIPQASIKKVPSQAGAATGTFCN